jgi:hypothetical protein
MNNLLGKYSQFDKFITEITYNRLCSHIIRLGCFGKFIKESYNELTLQYFFDL